MYGDDDRKEPFLTSQPAWLTEAAKTRLLALGDKAEVGVSRSGQLFLDVPTLQQRFDVCENEAFSQQPSFATCSGLIASSRHVLTAAHCTRAAPLTDQVGLARFYLEPSGALHTFEATDVHTFTKVVTREDYWDYAWLELAEPVPALPPLRLGTVVAGDSIFSVQHGAGLPAKALTSSVVSVDDGSFLSTLDSFGGASGAPVFSATGDLVGMLTSGAPDYVTTADGCLLSALRADAPEVAAERATQIALALRALCRAAEDPELCSTSPLAPEGDASCSIVRASPGLRAARTPAVALAFPLALLVFAWARRRRAARSS